jgi:DNA-binding CsgD family transcriptional regulator
MDYILSPRQYEIARLLAEDIGYKEIARRLCISPQTVKVTLARVQERLGVQSYVGIAVAVVTRNIVVEDMRGQGQQGRTRGLYRHGGR